jgi:hypothetical protein
VVGECAEIELSSICGACNVRPVEMDLGQLSVSTVTVRTLVAEQFAQWRHLRIEAVSSPGVTHHGRQTGVFGSEGPDEHPVRTDRNQRTGPIERVGVAVLDGAVEHID